MVGATKTWTTTSAAGGVYPGIDPVFFRDRNRVAVVTALSIKIYFLSTKQAVAKIPLDGSGVSQLYLSQDEETFYIVRENGSCDRVGIKENSTVKADLGKKVVKIISNDGLELTAVTSVAGGLAVTKFTPSDEGYISENLVMAKSADLAAISQSKEYVGFAYRRTKDTVLELYHIPSQTHEKVIRDKRTHSLAVSNNGLIAVGAPTGVIDLYYQKGIRTLKWHLEEVEALAFSLNGEYLLSGGKEKVLVFWQLETDKHTFLPRLDGEITGITVNDNSTLYGITLGGIQLVVISAVDLLSRLQVSGTKPSFVKLPADPEKEKRRRRKSKITANTALGDYTTNYTIHPGTRQAFFFAGAGEKTASKTSKSQVQIFNPIKDEQEGVLSVAPSVQMGKVRKELDIPDATIAHLKFTPNGNWMVTVDTKTFPVIDGLISQHDVEVNLKFWKLDRSTNKWDLVTKISSPHGPNKVIADICCDPTHSSVLTISQDGGLRLWRPDVRGNSWSLRKVLAPFGMSSKSVSLAWSDDSSVIAIGFETSIYLVDAKSCKLHSLVPNILDTRVRGLRVVGNYLIALAKTRLVVWDLVASKQAWAIKVYSPSYGDRLLAVDPIQKKIALATNYWTTSFRVNARVTLFDITSPVPIASLFHGSAISGLAQIPGTSSYSFIDVRGVINTVAGSSPNQVDKKLTLQQTLLALHSAANADDSVQSAVPSSRERLDVNSFDKVFDGGIVGVDALFDRVLSLVSPKAP